MKKSWQALLGGVLFYSVSSLLVKATASPPVTIAFYRVFIATLVVTPFWLKISFFGGDAVFLLPLICGNFGIDFWICTLVLFTPFYYGGSCYFYCEHGTSVGGCDEHRVLKGAHE